MVIPLSYYINKNEATPSHIFTFILSPKFIILERRKLEKGSVVSERGKMGRLDQISI